MQKAFLQPHATLDAFLVKARSPPKGTRLYAVKIGIHEGKNTEYFWVNEFREIEGGFSGKINNSPEMVRSVKLGQVYKFTKVQIVDWTYFDNIAGKTKGNFTACALLTKEPAAEAEAMRKEYGLSCE